MRQINILSESGGEPVNLSDVKNYIKVDFSDDDVLIETMLTTARVWCENYISRDIVVKQREYFLPKTNGVFDLPFGPIATIDEVKINGSVTTAYDTLGFNNETIELNAGESEKVIVKYTTAGYTDANLNTNMIKSAIMQLVSTYYDNRSEFEVGVGINNIPTGVTTILSSLKSQFI
ncbi:MAG: putative head completion protein [Prokaryotic dsDNA virus sp.]|nr:MAG: putative head completion protein [Prokaryotic dsDNA virus sp.]|tara:strand:+ start:1349 stop:1876 length:528 start_codon:yes stop_codon:yes gene_type:complete